MIKLIIVDDHFHVREAWSWVLNQVPRLSVIAQCANGQEAIEAAKSLQPDVILMDINLPGISGIEAMKILREYPPTTHIPIIALSANAMQRDIEKGLEAGFFRYLTKPIKINEFINALNDALKFSEIELGDTIKMDKYDDKRTRHS